MMKRRNRRLRKGIERHRLSPFGLYRRGLVSARELAGRPRLLVALLVFGLSGLVSHGLLLRDVAPDPPSTLGLAGLLPTSTPLAASLNSARLEPLGPEIPDWLERADLVGDRQLHASGTLKVRTGRIPQGGTLARALRDLETSPQVIDEIASGMRPVFDFRHCQPGDFFALIASETGDLLSFEYQRGRSTIYKLERAASGALVATREEVALDRRVILLAGVIDSSLFRSVTELGEGGDLAQNFADVFVWDFDFSTQTRPGDEFRMVVEKFYDRKGFVRYGNVLAAQYTTPKKRFTGLYFEDQDGYGDYFTPEGNSVRRTFLRAPVKYRRISSRYSKSRLHPVLKVRRPHEGIDYAAPTGTPVWAVADGVVTHKRRTGGYGRLIKIRHPNGYTSYYGHLSAYADGLKVGSSVRQKQVIGRVGSTGLATGPHLDYRLRVNRHFVDPLKVRFPKGKPIPVKWRSRFDEIRKIRLAELHQAQPPLVLEAAM